MVTPTDVPLTGPLATTYGPVVETHSRGNTWGVGHGPREAADTGLARDPDRGSRAE